MRYDIISDTHGYLSNELLAQLDGCDVIVHAGDICSYRDYLRLQDIAPLEICLGNSDYGYDYGNQIKSMKTFIREGLLWHVCHYKEKLSIFNCDVAVCGHTHKPFLEHGGGKVFMNPGSASYPRGGNPSMGRIIVEDEEIVSAKIIEILPA